AAMHFNDDVHPLSLCAFKPPVPSFDPAASCPVPRAGPELALAFAATDAQIAAMSANLHPIRPGRTPSLEPMIQLVASDLNQVNSVILDRMQSEVVLIPELAGHLIAGGGKRMRPM